MGTPIKVTAAVIPNAEQWLRDNIADLHTDNVCSIQRTSKWKLDTETKFIDTEDETTKMLTMQDFVVALQALCDAIGKTLFVGCITNPADLSDPCNWDAEVVDAFYQFAYHKAVIYG